jgi:hypothetical protein
VPAVGPLPMRTGFEIELIAPVGSSRRALADEIARAHRGRVLRVFHVDSEPSLVPGMGRFWHLTPGYRIDDGAGDELATLVDDITIVADLVRERSRAGCGAPAHPRCAYCTPCADPEAFRIVSDDLRLLRLAEDTTGPETTIDSALDGLAAVFRVAVDTVGPVRRARDRAGASIAMATTLAPGRERPCEIVTPPFRADHEATLERLLAPARALGFRVPEESATHVHVDGAPFRNVPAFANLVRLFGYHRDGLHRTLGTNLACVRIGPLPPAVLTVVDAMARSGADWPKVQAATRELGLTKYLDVNLVALLDDAPRRDTVEIRILPGALDGNRVAAGARTVTALLERCLDPTPIPAPAADVSSNEFVQSLVAQAGQV